MSSQHHFQSIKNLPPKCVSSNKTSCQTPFSQQKKFYNSISKHNNSHNSFQSPQKYHSSMSTQNKINASMNNALQEPKQNSHLMQKLDNEFVKVLKEVESYYLRLTKHEQIRVEKWIFKIIENDQTIRWKLNRNNYLKLLHYHVKTYQSIRDPFDKIPNSTNGLPYLSEHQLNQKIMPKFDGKSPSFHIKKPEMIKISEPIGDNCSVLLSLVNTARSQMSKQNNLEQINIENRIIQQIVNIKESKLAQDRHYIKNGNHFVKKLSFVKQPSLKSKSQCKLTKNKLSAQQKGKQVKQTFPKPTFQLDQSQNQQEEMKYAPSCNIRQKRKCNGENMLSNLPSQPSSQVKSINQITKTISINPLQTPMQVSVSDRNFKSNIISYHNNPNSTSNRPQKHNNHKKYSEKNSIQSQFCNLMNNLTPVSYSKHRNNKQEVEGREQLIIYKQLVLMMGKLLLKHQFAIQREGEYWELMRMIFEYQNQNRHYQIEDLRDEQNVQKQEQFSRAQTFEEFLHRLKEQIQLNNSQQCSKNHNMSHCWKDNHHHHDNEKLKCFTLMNDKSHPRQHNSDKQQPKQSTLFSTNQKVRYKNSDSLSLDTQHLRQQNNESSSFNQKNDQTNASIYIKKLYNEEKTINHITEESADFKVEEGVDPSRILQYELNSVSDRRINDETIRKQSDSHLLCYDHRNSFIKEAKDHQKCCSSSHSVENYEYSSCSFKTYEPNYKLRNQDYLNVFEQKKSMLEQLKRQMMIRQTNQKQNNCSNGGQFEIENLYQQIEGQHQKRNLKSIQNSHQSLNKQKSTYSQKLQYGQLQLELNSKMEPYPEKQEENLVFSHSSS